MNADVLRAELAALEQKRVQAVAALQQIVGAIGFAKHLLEQAEAQEKRETE